MGTTQPAIQTYIDHVLITGCLHNDRPIHIVTNITLLVPMTGNRWCFVSDLKPQIEEMLREKLEDEHATELEKLRKHYESQSKSGDDEDSVHRLKIQTEHAQELEELRNYYESQMRAKEDLLGLELSKLKEQQDLDEVTSARSRATDDLEGTGDFEYEDSDPECISKIETVVPQVSSLTYDEEESKKKDLKKGGPAAAITGMDEAEEVNDGESIKTESDEGEDKEGVLVNLDTNDSHKSSMYERADDDFESESVSMKSDSEEIERDSIGLEEMDMARKGKGSTVGDENIEFAESEDSAQTGDEADIYKDLEMPSKQPNKLASTTMYFGADEDDDDEDDDILEIELGVPLQEEKIVSVDRATTSMYGADEGEDVVESEEEVQDDVEDLLTPKAVDRHPSVALPTLPPPLTPTPTPTPTSTLVASSTSAYVSASAAGDDEAEEVSEAISIGTDDDIQPEEDDNDDAPLIKLDQATFNIEQGATLRFNDRNATLGLGTLGGTTTSLEYESDEDKSGELGSTMDTLDTVEPVDGVEVTAGYEALSSVPSEAATDQAQIVYEMSMRLKLFEDDLMRIKEEHDEEIETLTEELEDKHKETIKTLERKHNEEVDALKEQIWVDSGRESDDRMRTEKEAHSDRELLEQLRSQLKAMQSECDKLKAELDQCHSADVTDSSMEGLRTQYEQQLETLRSQLQETHTAELDNLKQQLGEKYASEIDDLETDRSASDIKESVDTERLKEEIMTVKRDLEMKIKEVEHLKGEIDEREYETEQLRMDAAESDGAGWEQRKSEIEVKHRSELDRALKEVATIKEEIEEEYKVKMEKLQTENEELGKHHDDRIKESEDELTDLRSKQTEELENMKNELDRRRAEEMENLKDEYEELLDEKDRILDERIEEEVDKVRDHYDRRETPDVDEVLQAELEKVEQSVAEELGQARQAVQQETQMEQKMELEAQKLSYDALVSAVKVELTFRMEEEMQTILKSHESQVMELRSQLDETQRKLEEAQPGETLPN